MRIPEPMRGGVCDAAKYNELLEFCKNLILTVGPGLEMKQIGGRQAVGLRKDTLSCSQEPLDLTLETGSVSWSKEEWGMEGYGCILSIACNITYDAGLHTLSFLYRTITIDCNGQIVEVSTGDSRIIAVAAECP